MGPKLAIGCTIFLVGLMMLLIAHYLPYLINTGDSTLVLKAVLPPVMSVLLTLFVIPLLFLTCYFRHRRRKGTENSETAIRFYIIVGVWIAIVFFLYMELF